MHSSVDAPDTFYVFTYPGWKEDMKDVKGNVVDPNWSIKSFSALEKCWGLRKMRNKQQCYDGVYLDPSVLRLMNGEFSYRGFEEDKNVLMDKFRYGTDIKKFMAVLEMKQEAKDKGLSHPIFLFNPGKIMAFSYDGWKEDVEEIYKSFDIRSSLFGTNSSEIRKKLASMQKNQDIAEGRYNDPNINVLQSGNFSYPNSERDKKCILTWISNGWSFRAAHGLKDMKMRQKVHDGDSTHPILSTIREKRDEYTYHDFEYDFEKVKDILLRSKLELFESAELRAEQKLSGMENKQKLYSGVDIIGKIMESGLFSYEDFNSDRLRTLNAYGNGFDVKNHLDSMILKQQIQNGANSDPIISAIDKAIGLNDEKGQCKSKHTSGKRLGKECVICMENPKTHAFVPCGHLALCQECAQRPPYRHQCRPESCGMKCPICRKESTLIMKVYGND
mmetsp:Transcript_29967/g.45432  ORF Transcript_29967/g.45432 Transcript_29967/m.45432 type:complete len:445 (-) Transcript_29967:47-1381(-)